MFKKIFEKLGNDFNYQKELINKKKIYDAYESIKDNEDNKSISLKAIIYLVSKKYAKALKILKKLINEKIDIIDEDVLNELIGVCYFQDKNYLEATKYFMKSLNINKDNYYSKFNLSNIYIIKEDFINARELLLDLKEIDPENKIILNNLSLVEKRL